jgi:hypothetical protein
MEGGVMESLKKVLMQRDKLTEAEAERDIAAAKSELIERIDAGEMPFDLCEELFGLEPDYLEELML